MSSISALYVPVHRRHLSASSTPSSSRTPSPSPSSSSSFRSPSPISYPAQRVYTPADLLTLAGSPLAQRSTAEMDGLLRAVAPELVQTRKQRKAAAWRARQSDLGSGSDSGSGSRPPRRTSGKHAHAHTSESEEDRAEAWRRV